MRCNQRLMPTFRAQRRKVLRHALERQTVKRVGRAMVDVSAQHQFRIRCGQRREVEQTKRRRPRYPFPSSPTASNIFFSSSAAAAYGSLSISSPYALMSSVAATGGNAIFRSLASRNW
jgi:hypothetical protein